MNRVWECETLISKDEVLVLAGNLEDVVVICCLIFEPVDGARALITGRHLAYLESPSFLGFYEAGWACVFCDLIEAEHWSVCGRARSGGRLDTHEDLLGPYKV